MLVYSRELMHQSSESDHFATEADKLRLSFVKLS